MRGILKLLWMLPGEFSSSPYSQVRWWELMSRVMSQGRAEGKLEIWVE